MPTSDGPSRLVVFPHRKWLNSFLRKSCTSIQPVHLSVYSLFRIGVNGSGEKLYEITTCESPDSPWLKILS